MKSSDDKIKKQISFDETLVVSCAHDEGTFNNEFSDYECSNSDSSEAKVIKRNKNSNSDIKGYSKESVNEEEKVEEESNFHFYFFPDCNKSKTRLDDNRKAASVVIEDGFPKITKNKTPSLCTCKLDKTGKCPCFLKVPCECGAKKRDECTCHKAENICICGEVPQIKCKCKPKNVCMCHPDGKPRPICRCGLIEKPCICQPDKFPFPICLCDNKAHSLSSLSAGEEEVAFEESTMKVKQPCDCQKLSPKPICRCIKGQKCFCVDTCLCGVQPTCLCDFTEEQTVCTDMDSKAICCCPTEPECKCYGQTPENCACFPEVKICTCGSTEECKCFLTCECKEPCMCDIQLKNEDVCVCNDSENTSESYENVQEGKLKRVRAGKHGYRWCHDVDPKHTFFNYAYNRHKNISYKEQNKEKLKILGLYEEPKKESVDSAVENDKIPAFRKKIRKPSIDCCSAVGGISISVEVLGEDKDKFLVQVVSNASKEGAKTGSKLISIIDCNLHTLEENRTEHITKKNVTKEHRSYMAICESGYYNKVTRVCGERHFVKRLYHNFDAASNFLLEGANVILLRYFAINRTRGRVKTHTVLINGTICESIYVCQGVSQSIVNGKPFFVSKVERHIIEPTGFVHQTLTVLTLKGYIVSHEWADSSYIFHINPLLNVVPERDEIEPHEPLRERWRNDLQLLSDYLDFKSTRSSEGARYVTENGELSGVIRDYLQSLLLIRPQDALHFTQHYFSSAFSALDLPHDEFFDSCSKRVRYYFFED